MKQADTPVSDTLLDIRGLKIDAQTENGWTEIVHGVDLTLKRGEVLGLIGESGAGKSTIGLAAMGFARDGCRISAGSIRLDGIDLRSLPEHKLNDLRGRKVAYVAQSAAASFNPTHRLLGQCIEPAIAHGVKSRGTAEREMVGLYTRLLLPQPAQIGQRFPHQVSGGQLQRVMTAMAMGCCPDLIIFDEPTTALDVTTQIEVLAAIRDTVKRFGVAAIYISHDLAVVAQMADRIVVLKHGREVEEAPTAVMMHAPREDYTRTLWAVRCRRRDVKPPMALSSTPLLSIRHVDAGYGAVQVLKDVSFDVHPGRTVAVVGESGSGKSTAARMIAGLLQPQSGQALLDGLVLPADYRKRSRKTLQRIQMIYQMADTALNPRLRIRDIIGRPLSFYLGLRGTAKTNRIAELLTQIELDPTVYMDRYPCELSGGQKQRVGIARALAAEPDLIICDEVTSALDQVVAAGILDLLDRLQKKLGIAYLFITHDLSTVLAIADDVVVMKSGKVVAFGNQEKVLQASTDPYVAELLASVPEPDPEWLTNLLSARRVNEHLTDAG
ncbi:MAG: Glutathione import ATP-binding protein GsiA [Burkholderia lata]|uniref:Glutathione import ATP-binding protein GsiA n=1 Tax=Burkholderia lata (strain ATCC 17760 / DSM 23089 / LMG 22485 / NCIMB 9086 / R18194 / 383) TaxID=482957 RepID=A0A833PQ69_BURL3|nr:ABC transporter ATP-binding protein [Burkholderia lata]KAF1036149.1 MAG: Glutathione import ATP-binding protein GsiA [Burkholderia lata]